MALAFGIVTAAATAQAANVITQTSQWNPTKNGFTAVMCCGSGAIGAGKNVNGTNVWAMGGGDSADQFAYARALTTAQAGAVAKNPFVVTAAVQVLPGSVPAYTQTSPVVIAQSLLDNGQVRWEMDIGVDASGDPVVVLPNSHNNSGPGGTILSNGASYVVKGAAASFNRYQLVVSSGKASLYVNGNRVLTNYTGDTSFVSNAGLVFAVASGGQANYNLVELSSTANLP